MSDKDKDGNVDKPKSAVFFFVILLLVLVFGLDPALLPLVGLLLLILLRDFPQSVEVLFLLAPADWLDLLLLVGLLLFIAPGLVDRPVDVVLFPVLDVVVLVDFALLPKYSHRLSQKEVENIPTPYLKRNFD